MCGTGMFVIIVLEMIGLVGSRPKWLLTSSIIIQNRVILSLIPPARHRELRRVGRVASGSERDFQGIPARDENSANSIMSDDYFHIIKKRGWQRVHMMQAPLSSERFTGNAVSAMQKKKSIGVTSR